MSMDFDIGIALPVLVAATHGSEKWNYESASESLYVNVSATKDRATIDSGYVISMHNQLGTL